MQGYKAWRNFRELLFHAIRRIGVKVRAGGGSPGPLFAVRGALLALDYLVCAHSVCRSRNENILAVALVAQAASCQGDEHQRQHP
jgi:hypothetical protein